VNTGRRRESRRRRNGNATGPTHKITADDVTSLEPRAFGGSHGAYMVPSYVNAMTIEEWIKELVEIDGLECLCLYADSE
jgi:hypothetical protein